MSNIQTYTVDLDNPSDIKKHISRLQKHRKHKLQILGYTQISFNGNKHNFEKILPIFEELIYSVTIEPGNYYVYAHTDPRKKLRARDSIKDAWLALINPNILYKPFYIGKGIKDRYLDFNRNDSHRKIRTAIKQSNMDIAPILLFEGVSESCALSLEEALIDGLGLISLCSEHGYLTNLDEGRNSLYRRSMYSKKVQNIVRLNKFNLEKV
jgi:hypothetical protein